MPEEPQERPRDLRLVAYVALGIFLGVIYVVFDVLSETRLEHGTLTGALARAHTLVDRASPVLVGALLGVCAHYFRLREQLSVAEEAASRAEVLRTRLQKVERDQAVWVLAAAVLHELNNPLHALGLLLDELGYTDDPVRRADLIGRSRGQADRALSHLGLLRSMGKSGEPDVHAVALDRVVAGVANDVGALAAESGLVVSLECKEPVLASADPTYVRTILENILDNSLHSLRERSGGRITIRLQVERDRAVVRVCDDGPAIDPRIRDALFEPLRSTKTEGLGLGLPIARALARAMEGDLSLDDVDEKTFRLELPLGLSRDA